MKYFLGTKKSWNNKIQFRTLFVAQMVLKSQKVQQDTGKWWVWNIQLKKQKNSFQHFPSRDAKLHPLISHSVSQNSFSLPSLEKKIGLPRSSRLHKSPEVHALLWPWKSCSLWLEDGAIIHQPMCCPLPSPSPDCFTHKKNVGRNISGISPKQQLSILEDYFWSAGELFRYTWL